MAKCYEALGNTEVAVITYEKSFKCNSTDAQLNYYKPALLNYSALLMKLNRAQEAIVFLEMYLRQQNARDEQIMNNLAILYQLTEGAKKAD